MDLSIIIPAFNEQEYITNLFESVSDSLSGIDQTYEIIVVDNGSNDDTKKISKNYTTNCYSINKSSISYARNYGVSKSCGKVLVFLDADVRITQKWAEELTKQYTKISAQLILTGARYIIRKKPSWIESNWFDPLSKKQPVYINGGNIIISRRCFDLIGGFDSTFNTAEDFKFCADAKNKGVTVLSNPAFVAIHDGYPRTIKAFMIREIWHGQGDFSSLAAFLNSKEALIAMLFGFAHIILLYSLWAADMRVVEGVTLLGIILMASLMSYVIFRSHGIWQVSKNISLCYLYLISRFISFFCVLKKK